MALIKANTKYGIAVGEHTERGRCTVFRGIPYAAAPTGERRFRAPEPPEPWLGERKFSRWASECIHFRPVPGDENKIGFPTAEDCLQLNLWTPAEKAEEGLPVLVWLYGGDHLKDQYVNGIDGLVSRKNYIIVTPIWRCGVLGWFGLEELEDRDGHNSAGNYGIMDILAALRWIQENIRAFGGDPSRVTLGGHDFGGMLAKALAGSKAADGLFHRLLLMSAGGTWDPVSTMTKAEKYRLCRAAMEAAGLTVNDMLYGDAEEISYRIADVILPADALADYGNMSFLRPSVDNWLLNEDAGSALYAGVEDRDVLCGTLETEWIMMKHQIPGGITGYESAFSAAAALTLAQRNTELNHKPVYHYLFSLTLRNGVPVKPYGELPYVFGRLRAEKYPWRDFDYLVENALMEYWARFIHTGNPNTPDLPEWPSYTQDEPCSLHITDGGIVTENLLLDNQTAEALDYLMRYPGVPSEPFHAEN